MKFYILVQINNYIGLNNKPYQTHEYFSRIANHPINKTHFYNGLPFSDSVMKFQSKEQAEIFINENNLTKLNIMKIEVFKNQIKKKY